MIRASKKMDSEARRNLASALRNSSHLLIAIALIVIWLPELRHFALSIAAFVAALVLATREFIQCLTGSIYHVSTKPYAIGDWIQIGPHSGEVTGIHILSTTLYEIDIAHGHYGFTGRTITVPNNLLVVSCIKNLNYTRRFVYHTFSITRLPEAVNVFALHNAIHQKVCESCEHFRETGRRYNALLEKRLDIEIPGPDPAIRVSTNELGNNVFTISIFCPTLEVEAMEHRITEEFMALWYEFQQKNHLEQVRLERAISIQT